MPFSEVREACGGGLAAHETAQEPAHLHAAVGAHEAHGEEPPEAQEAHEEHQEDDVVGVEEGVGPHETPGAGNGALEAGGQGKEDEGHGDELERAHHLLVA